MTIHRKHGAGINRRDVVFLGGNGEGERVALLTLQPEFARLSRSEDRQEYIRSLQERRAPVYVGH